MLLLYNISMNELRIYISPVKSKGQDPTVYSPSLEFKDTIPLFVE